MEEIKTLEVNKKQVEGFQISNIIENIKNLTEKMLLDTSVHDWVMQMNLLQVQGYSSAWAEIEDHLASICTQSNIRYIYFDVITERAKMKQVYTFKANLEKMNYEDMTQILADFAQANLNYMDYIYTDAVFSGDQELLMLEEKASLWIANGLSLDNSQWREKLQCYGEAAKIYPLIGDFVKRYMQLYGNILAT